MRLVIVGGPNAGKTTLARSLATEMDLNTLHTDDMIDQHLDRDQTSSFICEYWLGTADTIIEGVSMPHALRHWLRTKREPLPVDKVIWLHGTRIAHTKPGQAAMTKGIDTIMGQIVGSRGFPELIERTVS